MSRTSIGFILILSLSCLGLGLWAHDLSQTGQSYDLSENYRAFTETLPPVGPVRPVAEWEPSSHVLIRYPLGIPISLVNHLSNTAQVITLVSNTNSQNQATTAFTNAGVNMANVSFFIAPTDSYWTRDYGPWFIVNGNNQYSIVDFVYNRPRPNDNAIPSLLAPHYSYPYYGMNVQQTGGNYMTDGINTAAQTQIAYTENSSLGQTGVNQKMLAYLGISNYFVINDPNNTYIDHIDCWGKFLAPDKVLIRSVPTSHSQYDEIEAVANFFATTNNAWGYPYRVYRVNTPQNQPYTNSLILNKKVFVPIMNNSHDNAALQVYRNALPNYEVIGVAGTTSAPWESTDALHCRTHEIADKQALFIEHTPYRGVYDLDESIDINVNIRAFSNAALYSDSLFVSYKINQGVWQRLALTELVAGFYTAVFDQQAPGDTIRYFIHAADQSGRSMDHPYTAASDPHIFSITGDSIAPTIVHEPMQSITNMDIPIQFVAIITDNHLVQQAILETKIDDDPVQSFAMTSDQNDTWIALYNTNFNATQTTFSYRIVASDNANPPNQSIFPSANSWISIPIDVMANDDEISIPIGLQINSISPNPFRASKHKAVSIDFASKLNQEVEIGIFNVRGQKIHSMRHLSKANGQNRINWYPLSQNSNNRTPGVYIIQLKAGKQVSSRKLIISE